jgi:uncharacterized protein (DUF1800 family)
MTFTRRSLLLAGGFSLLGLAGCGTDDAIAALIGSSNQPTTTADDSRLDLISHTLQRLTFGVHPDDRRDLLRMGATPDLALTAWLERQLTPSQIDDSDCERLVRRHEALAQPLGELYEFKERVLQRELSTATLLRASYSRRQLQQRVVGFWNDHFNVDSSKGECAWVTVAFDRDVIRKHALGRFPELLRAVAVSPAMLWYLDGRVNCVSDHDSKPNENFARELLELHTLGLDGGYTQQDIMEIARCLSGWTVRDRHGFRKGRVEFHRAEHDNGAKSVLGQVIPAGGGEKDLDQVLHLVATHPSTARHLATKLCRHFLSDEPPASAISAVAATFTNSAGDIRQCLRTLITSDEFRDPAIRGAKLKRPFHHLASCLRSTAAVSDCGPALHEHLHRTGQAPFQFPTPDGQPDTASAWTGSLLWRWRLASSLAQNQLGRTSLDVPAFVTRCGGTDGMIAHLLGRQPTANERARCRGEAANVLALLLASPDFQRC